LFDIALATSSSARSLPSNIDPQLLRLDSDTGGSVTPVRKRRRNDIASEGSNKRAKEGHEDTLIGELKLMREAREAREVKKSKIELAIELLLAQYQEVLTEEEIVTAIDLVSDPIKATTFLAISNLNLQQRWLQRAISY
jgi:hypothetical protein